MYVKSVIIALAMGLIATLPTVQAQEKASYPVDKDSGLIMAPGWKQVKNQCNACHSSLIVAQNSGDREFWRSTLQWMIDSQGLWDLSDTWEPVLGYLTTYYGARDIDMTIFRRMPLNEDEMPPMPSKDK